MNWTQIRAAIEAHFAAQWVTEAGAARTPVEWENFLFDPRLDSNRLPKDIAPFVRLTIVEVSRGRKTLTGEPSTGQRYNGLLMIQAFTAADIGPGAVSGLIDQVDSIFCEKVISDIDFTESNVIGKDIDASGAWFFITLEFPFQHEN